jgi:hypothetical protein
MSDVQKQWVRKVISNFLAAYNGAEGAAYTVTGWPDEEDRRGQEVDAYAQSPGFPPLAIEHTAVESFEGEFQDAHRFVTTCGALEDELRPTLPQGVELTINRFSFLPGMKWDRIKGAIRDWLLRNVPALPHGRHRPVIVGVPFPVTVTKGDLPHKFVVARWAPTDEEINRGLLTSMKLAVNHKGARLGEYRVTGARSVLLLECGSILVSPATVYMAFLAARPFVKHPVDQVWYAHTSSWHDYCKILCLEAPEELMDRANPANAMFGPRYAEYWAAQ